MALWAVSVSLYSQILLVFQFPGHTLTYTEEVKLAFTVALFPIIGNTYLKSSLRKHSENRTCNAYCIVTPTLT